MRVAIVIEPANGKPLRVLEMDAEVSVEVGTDSERVTLTGRLGRPEVVGEWDDLSVSVEAGRH